MALTVAPGTDSTTNPTPAGGAASRTDPAPGAIGAGSGRRSGPIRSSGSTKADSSDALLDNSTLIVSGEKTLYAHGSWAVSESVGAGEAAVWWRSRTTDRDRGQRGEGTERSSAEADRRARRQVRRYCVRNGLDRLGTLTYAPEHLPEQWQDVWADVERFRRGIYAEVGGPIPLVVTIERGEQSGRLHVHFAFGQFLDAGMVRRVWGKGFVDLRRLEAKGEGKRARCRRAAAYVAKYVTKGDSAEAGRQFDGRRYSTTHGFGCVRRSESVESYAKGLRQAMDWCGGEVDWSWSSSEDPDWPGTPVTVLHFGDP